MPSCIHVHTRFTFDCDLDPREAIRAAKMRRFHGIIVTEHHYYSVGAPIEEIAKEENFLVLRGAEYSSADGHVLLYDVREDSFNSAYYLLIAREAQ